MMPHQQALSDDQTRRVRADMQRILTANPLGILGQESPGIANGLLPGDLEITSGTRDIVHGSPLGQVIPLRGPIGIMT